MAIENPASVQKLLAEVKEKLANEPKLYEMFRERFGIDGEDPHFVLTLNREVVKGIGLPELQRFLLYRYCL